MEIDYEKLKKLGIDIADRDYTKSDPQKMLCPSCKSNRKKHKKNKPLAVYWKIVYHVPRKKSRKEDKLSAIRLEIKMFF